MLDHYMMYNVMYYYVITYNVILDHYMMHNVI